MNLTDEVDRNSILKESDLRRKKRQQYRQQLNHIRSFLARHFAGDRTASIRIHLKSDLANARFTASQWKMDTQWNIEDQADKIAKLFFNQLNERLYGKGYRYHGKHVRFCASLHAKGGNPHLHIVVEIPKDRKDFEVFRTFTEEFCRQPSLHYEVARIPYCEETLFNHRALHYNNDDTKCREFDDIDGPDSLRLIR